MRELNCCDKYFKDKLCEEKTYSEEDAHIVIFFILFAFLNERK
jgi:hypothetical protein